MLCICLFPRHSPCCSSLPDAASGRAMAGSQASSSNAAPRATVRTKRPCGSSSCRSRATYSSTQPWRNMPPTAASRPARPRPRWTQRCHVQQRAGRNASIRRPAHTENHRVATATASHSRAARAGSVMRVRCHCQPARSAISSRLQSRPQAIPAGITRLRRQIGQDQPRVPVAVLPAGQLRAKDLVARKGDACAAPFVPGCAQTS